jgi:hypothetical protein
MFIKVFGVQCDRTVIPFLAFVPFQKVLQCW